MSDLIIINFYIKVIKMVEKEETIEDRIIYNNYKLVADKIRKTLLKLLGTSFAF